MRWLWFYITHRTQLGKFHPIKVLQEQYIYCKILLVAILVFVLSLTGCTLYGYTSLDRELKVITWSDTGAITIHNCNVYGGKKAEALQVAVQ